MKRFALWGVLLAAALFAVLLAPGLTRAQAAPQQVNITFSEFAFSPNDITVTQGRPIQFIATNSGKFPHNISFKYEGKTSTVFASPIRGGQPAMAEYTFADAGTWEMFCPVGNHAAMGMVGKITVLAAGASATEPGMPTTGQPSDSLIPAGLVGLALLVGGLFARRRTRPAL